MIDTRDAVIRDSAAAAAAVLRAAGVDWPRVQALQSRIVAVLADDLQGELFPVREADDITGLASHDR